VFLGATKIGLGLIDRKVHTASVVKSTIYFLGATQPLAGNWVLDAQVARNDVKNSINDTTLYAVRATYNFSKRTGVYSSVGYVKNSGVAALAVDAGGTVGPGLSQTGVMVGMTHRF
jgi:predicted porin